MEKKTFHKLMAIFGVALAATLGINLYAVTVEGTPLYLIITSVCLMATALCGAVYVFTGYTKARSAVAFSCFTLAYAVSELVGISGLGELSIPEAYLLAVGFGFALVLGLGKDLGKTLSTVFALVIVLTSALRLVLSLVSGTGAVSNIVIASKIILGASLLMLVIAKYYDKAMRKAGKQ